MIRSVLFPYTVPAVPWNTLCRPVRNRRRRCFYGGGIPLFPVQLLGVVSVIAMGYRYHDHHLQSHRQTCRPAGSGRYRDRRSGLSMSMVWQVLMPDSTSLISPLTMDVNENTDLGEDEYSEGKRRHRSMQPFNL